jgi:hypothetical protein
MSGTNNIFPGGSLFPTAPSPTLPTAPGAMGGQFGAPQINQLSRQFGAAGGAPNTLPPFLTGQQNVLGGPANGAGGMPGGNPNLAMFGHFANMPLQPPGAMIGQPGGMGGIGGAITGGMGAGGAPGQNNNLMALFAALQNHPALNAALNPGNIPNATQFQPSPPAAAPAAPQAPPAAAPAAAPATPGGFGTPLTLAQLGVQNPNPDITSLPAAQQQQAFNTQLANNSPVGGGT